MNSNRYENVIQVPTKCGGERGYRRGFVAGAREAVRVMIAGLTPDDADFWLIALDRWKFDHAKGKPVTFAPPEAFAGAKFERRRAKVISDMQDIIAEEKRGRK